jgi:fructose-bisphosphate aldolase class II
LDHATDTEHLELALGLAEQGIAFDSIMVDASHAEVRCSLHECTLQLRLIYIFQTDEENIAIARPYVERARKCGIPVEVELGRLEGGEAGLRVISDSKLTDPRKAETFIREFVFFFFSYGCGICLYAKYERRTGATILAPSIGNLHGSYLRPPNFRLEM